MNILTAEELEASLSGFDEDYHISRYFHFTLDPAAENAAEKTYRINGFAQSHVSIDRDIEQRPEFARGKRRGHGLPGQDVRMDLDLTSRKRVRTGVSVWL